MTRRPKHTVFFLTLMSTLFLTEPAMSQPDATRYIEAVQTFADNALTLGKDVYGPKHTPLFVDGINIDTRAPATWKQTDGREWVISNLGNQQIFFRTLDGLTGLTGDARYRSAAQDALRYTFNDLWWDGLIPWGGHMAYDATTDTVVWAEDKAKVQELKCHYPHYELMWQTDPDKTRSLIEHIWSGHILDWSNLDFNRHATPTPTGDLWDQAYEGSPVFFWGKGLTFLNAGSDIFYAAAVLSHLTSDPKPLVWAKRLAARYDETRNPKTGLSGYQFSQTHAWCDGPKIRGDRAQYQYGDAFKDHHVAEGTLFMPYRRPSSKEQICQLLTGELLGENGREFAQYALTEVTAWGKAAYRKSDNAFIPMLTDGTPLEGFVIPKEGYFGPKGRVVQAATAGTTELWVYALACRIAGDPFLWDMARNIALGIDLGDIGAAPDEAPQLTPHTNTASTSALLAFLELHRKTGRTEYLDMACQIGDNILQKCFKKAMR